MSSAMPVAAVRPRAACLLCSARPQARRWYAAGGSGGTPPGKPKPPPPPPPSDPAAKRDATMYSVRIDAPRSYGEKMKTFTPQVIPRPIGMLEPPRPGENAGVDTRTPAEKRADALDYEKRLERRAALIKEFQRPYFRDVTNLRHHKGKSFLAPTRLFKAEHALYFPNMHGHTLEKKGADGRPPNRDTTPVLRGRTSIVAVFSNVWAENQVGTFISPKANPALHEVFREFADATPRQQRGQQQQQPLPQQQQHTQQRERGGARSSPLSATGVSPPLGVPLPQIVRVNIERSGIRAWLVRMFFWALRRHFARSDWGRYFLVNQPLADDVREATGMLNRTVGYVYLVDEHCRIRWAGSGEATDEERESLAKGLRRLVAQSES